LAAGIYPGPHAVGLALRSHDGPYVDVARVRPVDHPSAVSGQSDGRRESDGPPLRYQFARIGSPHANRAVFARRRRKRSAWKKGDRVYGPLVGRPAPETVPRPICPDREVSVTLTRERLIDLDVRDVEPASIDIEARWTPVPVPMHLGLAKAIVDAYPKRSR
jgi:hypothetical protein